MATAVCQLSEDEFRCSICLDVFNEPTSLQCGHNFCKGCIEQNWADKVLYRCPNCNQHFITKPELKINTFISEISKNFQRSVKRKNKTKKEAKPGEVACDLCSPPKSAARKSCLVCMASYCDEHLSPHETVPALQRHTLALPQSNLDEKVCPDHGKVLDMYCKNDDVCFCSQCVRRHSGHEVAPLSKASDQTKLQLAGTQRKLDMMIQTRKGKMEEVRRSVESSSADSEMSVGLMVFTALREALNRALDDLVQEVNEKQSRAKGLIQDLELEISELETRQSQVEQLSQSNDHLQVLQNAKNLLPIPRMKDWTGASASAQSFEGSVARALSKLEVEFNKTTREMFEGELRRVRRFETPVTLDGGTAHPQLAVHPNGVQVNHSIEQQKVLNGADRFDDFFVLGRPSFAENVYFEAEVRGKTGWTLGVAKETVNKKGRLKLDPQNGVWTIGLKNNNYFANAGVEIPLSPKGKPEKIGVFVDYEEGCVSFYDVENAALIHSFGGSGFGERLRLICSPGHFSHGNFAPLVLCQNTGGGGSASARRLTWPTKWPMME
ncbi:E3 ubiquitin-protein ligase TRIM21-like [Eucyclogobius newberryi]|uniref:E3 ubiquitin-protein ligase TRIM21-like n=1 Tax=Eucyclogobius newberryi TaxID=166745 RepID=UPI003B5C82D7